MKKYTIKQVAQIVESEGLDYAIQHYMGSDRIADADLAAAWDHASEALAAVEEILAGVADDQEDDEEDAE